MLKALLKSKSSVSPTLPPVSVQEEEQVKRAATREIRPDVTFGKPLDFAKALHEAEEGEEEDVSLVNLESKKHLDSDEDRPHPRRGDLSEAEIAKPPYRDPRRIDFPREVRNRPSQSPRPMSRSPEQEETKGKVIDETKYRRHKNLPKLVFSKPSNRKLIKNAILQVCLAGEAYKLQREEVIKVIDENAEVCNFVIVFRGELGRQDLKALYEFDAATEEVRKLYGPGIWPDVIDASHVHSYYRYDSGSKEFRQLQCRTFSIATDAVVLKTVQKVPKNALF